MVMIGKDAPFLVKLDNASVFYHQPSFWVALIALLVSIGGFIVNLRKDSRTRRQSIQDDFWLRKVLFPATVEPVLEFFATTLSDLPGDISDDAATTEKNKCFITKFQADHRRLSRKLLMIGMLGKDLYDGLSDDFGEFEDTVVNYCHANSGGYVRDQLPTSTRADAEAAISAHLNEMLNAIRIRQERMT